jgi:hypothetical protein
MSQQPKLAILFHISSMEIAIDMLKTHQFLFKNYPIFCSVVRDLVDERFMNHLQSKLNIQYIMVDNNGMDIGGLLSILDNFDLQRYDYFIKIHTKGKKDWRDGLIENLRPNLPLFGGQLDSKFIGLLMPETFNTTNRNVNYFWFSKIYNLLLEETNSNQNQLPQFFSDNVDFSYRFNPGTIFIIKRNVLLTFHRMLVNNDLGHCCNQLSKDSFDPSWFHFYYVRNLKGELQSYTFDQDILHAEYLREKNDKYGNGFHLAHDIKKNKLHPLEWPSDKISKGAFVGWSIRDGMFENAVERLFFVASELL